MHDLGRYTAAMHSADKTWFGYIRWDKTGRFDTWGEAFTYMVKEAAETCREQGIKLPYEEIFYEVEERRDMLNELKTPSFVDFDMWAGNVFVKKEARYSISGIIDFERSFMGDPLASFSSALFLYDNVEKETAFLEGYNEVSRESLVITDKDREKMALYELLMYLRAYAEIRRYNFLFAAMQRLGIRLMIADLLGRLRKMKKKEAKRRGRMREQWILCPCCKSKTRIKVQENTVLEYFPLFCPKCKQETLIAVKQFNVSVIREPDA